MSVINIVESAATIPMTVAFARQVVAHVDLVQADVRIEMWRDRESPRGVTFFVSNYVPDRAGALASDEAKIAAFRGILAFSVSRPVERRCVYESGDILLAGRSEFDVEFFTIVDAKFVDAVLAPETK